MTTQTLDEVLPDDVGSPPVAGVVDVIDLSLPDTATTSHRSGPVIDLTWPPEDHDPAPGAVVPVFVDLTGRRRVLARWCGRALAAACVCYIALVGAGVSAAHVGPLIAVPVTEVRLPEPDQLRGAPGALEQALPATTAPHGRSRR